MDLFVVKNCGGVVCKSFVSIVRRSILLLECVRCDFIVSRVVGLLGIYNLLGKNNPRFYSFQEVMMSLSLAIAFLVLVALPWTEGQFPRVCVTLDSLRSKECCPVPKGFSAPCGSDGNRGTCQELIIREWSFIYSHYNPFRRRTTVVTGPMRFTTKPANAIQILLVTTAASASMVTMVTTAPRRRP